MIILFKNGNFIRVEIVQYYQIQIIAVRNSFRINKVSKMSMNTEVHIAIKQYAGDEEMERTIYFCCYGVQFFFQFTITVII